MTIRRRVYSLHFKVDVAGASIGQPLAGDKSLHIFRVQVVLKR